MFVHPSVQYVDFVILARISQICLEGGTIESEKDKTRLGGRRHRGNIGGRGCLWQLDHAITDSYPGPRSRTGADSRADRGPSRRRGGRYGDGQAGVRRRGPCRQ